MQKALLICALVLLVSMFGQDTVSGQDTLKLRQSGVASFYGKSHEGKTMANGEPFNPRALTCASWSFPLGTTVVVGHNDKSVVVRVTDRGPARRLVAKGRVIDLSEKAFASLASTNLGLINVTIQKL